MTDTVVTLGDFAFSIWEVPQKIAAGGEQMVSIHQLQGGVRILDVLGPVEHPKDWTGRFRGADALDRARYLDGLRKAGKPLQLAWFDLAYTVVIRSFTFETERFYEVPYSISCEVVEDLTSPVDAPPETSMDEVMGGDMDLALDLGGEIGDEGLLGLLTGLQGTLGGASNLFSAGEAALGAIYDAIAGSMGTAAGLTAGLEAVIGGATTLGGVVTGAQPSANPAALSVQTSAADTLGLLYQLQSVLGRMGSNLSAVGTSGYTVTQAGGNLQTLAAQAYGDPSQWTAIAKANGLTDPVVNGLQDLRIPPIGDKSGGVLSRA
jgi:hypothetical protein